MERTLMLIKPDAVRRGLIGKIITRFEDRGIKIVEMRMLLMTSEMAKEHYAEHADKDFYGDVVAFMMSGPILAIVFEAEDIVRIVRDMAGATDSSKAEHGTIRGDFGLSCRQNVVHASDSVQSAEREIKIFFPEEI